MSVSINRKSISLAAKSLASAFLLAAILDGCVQPERETVGGMTPTLTKTIVLEGVRGSRPNVGIPGRIDHMAYDPVTGRLFVAALENGSLEVIDLDAGRRVRSIGGLTLPQGAAIVPAAKCVAVACGGDGRLHVYDTRTLEEKTVIDVGPDADNVRYDTQNGTLLVSYGDTNSGAIAVVDTRDWRKLRDISFNSRPEAFQLDPKSDRLFANLPKSVTAVEDGDVAIANRKNGELEAQVHLKDRARNFPMAYDATHQRLFIASRLPARLIAIDAKSRAIIAEAACTDDSDDLFYDSQTDCVLVVGGGFRPDLQKTASPASPAGETGAIDVFSLSAGGGLTRISTTPTAPHARTGLFVPSRQAIFIAVPPRDGRDPEIREYRFGR